MGLVECSQGKGTDVYIKALWLQYSHFRYAIYIIAFTQVCSLIWSKYLSCVMYIVWVKTTNISKCPSPLYWLSQLWWLACLSLAVLWCCKVTKFIYSSIYKYLYCQYTFEVLVLYTSVKLAPHMLKTHIQMVSFFSTEFVLNCAVHFIICAAIIIEIF